MTELYTTEMDSGHLYFLRILSTAVRPISKTDTSRHTRVLQPISKTVISWHIDADTHRYLGGRSGYNIILTRLNAYGVGDRGGKK